MTSSPPSSLATLLCGAKARSLAPRALESHGSGRVRLAYREEGLAADERARLTHAASDRGNAPAAVPGGERIIELEAQRLAELATESAGLELLWAAAQARLRATAPPRIWGVLNVTPDSFSDGGRFLAADAALERAAQMVAEGAHGIDVGGESTRPGSVPLDAAQELERVLPVVRAIAARWDLPLSIDTTKAEVARSALACGASVVNDVSAARFDADMLPLAARSGCELVLMHMQGTPRDMQVDPRYGDVVSDVLEFLRERAGAALAAGVAPQRLWIDPGIGFGKTLEHNLELLRRLGELRSLGLPVYVGVSRKAFIGRINAQAGRGGEPAGARLGGTAAAVAACTRAGAEALRVHDVAVMAEAARLARALQ